MQILVEVLNRFGRFVDGEGRDAYSNYYLGAGRHRVIGWLLVVYLYTCASLGKQRLGDVRTQEQYTTILKLQRKKITATPNMNMRKS